MNPRSRRPRVESSLQRIAHKPPVATPVRHVEDTFRMANDLLARLPDFLVDRLIDLKPREFSGVQDYLKDMLKADRARSRSK